MNGSGVDSIFCTCCVGCLACLDGGILRLLTETPSLGKPRPDLGAEVLSFPHVSHVIYYVVYEQQLVVFGVLHKRMVPTNHLDGRELF